MSVSFQGLDQAYFTRTAKIIAEVKEQDGSKISWVSTEPTVDRPGMFQGLIRTIKGLSKECIANGVGASEAALSWSKALVKVVKMCSEEDKVCFKAASKALYKLSAVYRKKYDISRNSNDMLAEHNYLYASIELFILYPTHNLN